MSSIKARRYLMSFVALCWLAASSSAFAADGTPASPSAKIDHSGKKQYGKASYYSPKLAHKKTTSGAPLNPDAMTAASKTLPLGTKAKVTNLATGQSAEVEINDRGPVSKSRIVDVTPKVAETIGLQHDGVSTVEVKPLSVPQPDGAVKQIDR